ncbi:hypothetical protein NliqN6_6311 [Naganishia liquefaciens]|uniref:HTH APSES-type domain-containing protein n=1 Tax=Naganishia liquefaciens TaxID=104408 RepID=A0A8H3TZE6_9TREE|nr:hypothetical protein NliqN6_6311 [Naganishia liquefaciens]
MSHRPVPTHLADEHVHPPPPAYELVPPIMPSEVAAENRPALPLRARNVWLSEGTSPTAMDPDALVVKFQTIVRDGKEIIVGRLKVPTRLPAPLEHAFILRRYDTGAISVTTMYKAAFPSATAEDEEREMKWIKSSFDMSGMNGSRTCNAVKLAGNWAPLNLARHLAPAYKLEAWVEAMCTARPEVGVAYRKSQRSQRAAEEASKPNVAVANPPAVPVPAPVPTTVDPVASPASARMNGSAQLAPPIAVPAASAPASAPAPAFTRVPIASASAPGPGTPLRSAKRSRIAQSPAAGTSNTASASADHMDTDDAPVNPSQADHVTVTLQSTHQVHAPLHTSPSDLAAAAEAEIAASKADVLRLRQEALARSAAGESAADMGLVAPQPGISGGPGANLARAGTGGVRGVKRTTEDVSAEDDNVMIPAGAGSGAAVTTALRGSGEGRVIAGNRRIVNNEAAAQRQNRWGTVALVAGMAASYLASNFLF